MSRGTAKGWVALACATLAVTACGDDEQAPPGQPEDQTVRSVGAVKARWCEVGSRPDYFVPTDKPPVVFGCARLTASDETVELSANAESFGGRLDVCINPAYPGRGSDGSYIPASCVSQPVPTRLRVVDASEPGSGRSAYDFVIWGTAGVASRTVMATSGDQAARAAVFPIEPPLAKESARSSRSACSSWSSLLRHSAGEVTIESSQDGQTASALVEPRSNLCDRAS